MGDEIEMIWVLLLLALIFRLVNLNQSLWLDEATQVTLSIKPLSSIWYERVADFHPPLSYLVFHLWMKVSNSEVWLRLLPSIFGVLTVALTYLLSTKLFNKRVGLISGLLLAINPYHIYYSQEIRMYSLAALLVTWSMYLLYQLLSSKKLIFQLGYLLANLLAIYTLYTTLFALLAQLIFVGFFNREKLKRVFLLNWLVVVGYLPWLPQLISQLQGGSDIDSYLPGWREVLSLDVGLALPLTLFKFTAGRIDFSNQTIYLVVGVAVLLLVAFLALHFLRRMEVNSWLVLIWFMTPLLCSLVVSFIFPLNQPFRSIFVLPAWIMILAFALDSLKKYQKFALGMLVALALAGTSMYYFNPGFQREDWRGATNFVRVKLAPADRAVFVWPEPFPPYQWYAQNFQAMSLGANLPYDYNDINQKLTSLPDSGRVFLFEYLQDLADPERQTQRWLADHGYNLLTQTSFEGVGFIDIYER